MRTCKACKAKFEPNYNTMQKACSVSCALDLAKQDKERKRKRENARAKREYRENDLSWWLSVDKDSDKCGGNTAHWLHKWIREVRDKEKPCVMCGSFVPKGGIWHACHYRSRGAAKQLRFEPDNIHKGCKHCNTRTEGDTGAKFSAELVIRLGAERVAELDNNNETRRWTIDECRKLRDYYKELYKSSVD